jgi:hypothetical protein
MGWRESLLEKLGPGFAGGMSLPDWLRLLWENGFRVHPRCWLKAASATLCSAGNTPLRWLEHWLYSGRLAAQPVKPPLFLLGHFRNGTTHLHNLLAVDSRFSYPRASQVVIPHEFLLAERVMAAVGSFLLPRTRFGVDNMALHPHSPAEEESALGLLTGLSPYLGWMFPERAEHYSRYLTFRDVPAQEVERWKAAYVALVRKLSWRDERPLVLKSPPNTCRIMLLVETFPGAKFVHVHRNPYVVYQSTMHLMVCALRIHGFQRARQGVLHAQVVRQYQLMYEVFFQERQLVPSGRYCEVAFEKLETDPVGQMRQVYQELDLPDFGVVEPKLEGYVRSLTGYRKNRFPEIAAEVRSEIAQAWQRCFDEWEYSTASPASSVREGHG